MQDWFDGVNISSGYFHMYMYNYMYCSICMYILCVLYDCMYYMYDSI